MLWSLLVSGYIIYLYRKLNAEGKPEAAPSGGSGKSAIESELAKLSERLGVPRKPACPPPDAGAGVMMAAIFCVQRPDLVVFDKLRLDPA